MDPLSRISSWEFIKHKNGRVNKLSNSPIHRTYRENQRMAMERNAICKTTLNIENCITRRNNFAGSVKKQYLVQCHEFPFNATPFGVSFCRHAAFPSLKIERATRSESGIIQEWKRERSVCRKVLSEGERSRTRRVEAKRNGSLFSPRTARSSYIIPLFIANIQQRQGNEAGRTKLRLSLINLRSIRVRSFRRRK